MAGILTSTPRAMRRTLRGALLLAGFGLAGSMPAAAQQQNCIVRQAADAAVQRQIALIDGAKVNPSSFFNGPNSCIATDLLKRFDLSNLIPDLSGFLTSGAMNLLTGVLDAAKRQVCQILDDQLRDTIRSINQNMYSFQGSVSGDLFRQLNGSISPMTVPTITGIGSYQHVQSTAFGSALTPTTPTPTSVQPIAPSPVPAQSLPVPSPSGSAFGEMFK